MRREKFIALFNGELIALGDKLGTELANLLSINIQEADERPRAPTPRTTAQ